MRTIKAETPAVVCGSTADQAVTSAVVCEQAITDIQYLQYLVHVYSDNIDDCGGQRPPKKYRCSASRSNPAKKTGWGYGKNPVTIGNFPATPMSMYVDQRRIPNECGFSFGFTFFRGRSPYALRALFEIISKYLTSGCSRIIRL